jgi:hypothetical protein
MFETSLLKLTKDNMINFKEYMELHKGQQVVISSTSGRFNGILYGSKTDLDGNIVSLILQQYFHRTEVQTSEILNVRLIE